MNFRTAIHIARSVERDHEELIVAGLRRTSSERMSDWAIDVVNPDTGRLVTIDEKDDIERMVESALDDNSRR
jgi:hypothetical protein